MHSSKTPPLFFLSPSLSRFSFYESVCGEGLFLSVLLTLSLTLPLIFPACPFCFIFALPTQPPFFHSLDRLFPLSSLFNCIFPLPSLSLSLPSPPSLYLSLFPSYSPFSLLLFAPSLTVLLYSFLLKLHNFLTRSIYALAITSINGPLT